MDRWQTLSERYVTAQRYNISINNKRLSRGIQKTKTYNMVFLFCLAVRVLYIADCGMSFRSNEWFRCPWVRKKSEKWLILYLTADMKANIWLNPPHPLLPSHHLQHCIWETVRRLPAFGMRRGSWSSYCRSRFRGCWEIGVTAEISQRYQNI